MTSTIPELLKVGIKKETSWGTAPAGAPLLIPVNSHTLKGEIEHVVDSGVRGVLGVDFQVYGGPKKVTGSIGGSVYVTETASGSVEGTFAHILRAFFGDDDPDQIGAGPNYIHSFFEVSTPGSFAIQLEDAINSPAEVPDFAGALVPVYLGMVIPRLTLRYNGGEGLLTWDADLLGARQTWPTSGTAIAADKSGKALIGWQASTHFGSAAANPTALGKVLSAEITMEREISLHFGGSNQQYPNIVAARPVRATFSAVVELQDYADYKLYDDGSSDFSSNIHAWTFRFSTLAGVGTATADTALDTVGELPSGDGVLDIRFHRVSYGESPLNISRDQVANTLEFSGRALYDNTAAPTSWFGAVPASSTTVDGQRLVQVRIINQRTSAY